MENKLENKTSTINTNEIVSNSNDEKLLIKDGDEKLMAKNCNTKLIIISGGETGADKSAILCAKDLELEIQGYVPLSYWKDSRSGIDEKFKDMCINSGMKECKLKGYQKRDEANVNICDILIAFRINVPKSGRGTMKTVGYAAYGVYNNVVVEDELKRIIDSKKLNDKDGDDKFNDGIYELDYKIKPALIIWDPQTNINKDKYPDIIRQFIIKHIIKRCITKEIKFERNISGENYSSNVSGENYSSNVSAENKTNNINVIKIMISGPLEKTSPGIESCIHSLLVDTLNPLCNYSDG